MKVTWQYYRPDYGDKPDDAQNFLSYEIKPGPAVERICESRFSDWDYRVPDSIMIRKAGDSDWLEFECEVASVPQFSASRRIRA